ncbi:MAG: HIT domain-containing protein [Deltaproteobacteria bacterium]|nr:HIT domain-containing protein [Deltaproteobacteria bacterium]MCW5802973.1 HIT domain-containing protein [Deltaproteobacteria bacterium]
MIRLDKRAALARVAAANDAPACRMCALVRDAEPIAATDEAVAILDAFATRPGHILVLLRRHEERLAHLAWPEYQALQHLAWRTCRALEAALAPRRIYVASLGSAEPLATSFPHVHLHVVPLADGGEADRPASVFTWAHGMYVFESAGEEAALRARLVAALP